MESAIKTSPTKAVRGIGTNDAKVVVDSSSVQSDDGETQKGRKGIGYTQRSYHQK